MALLLCRLGRFSFRRRGLVLALWVAALAVSGVAAAMLSAPTSDSFSIPGTEAQQALDLLAKRMPEAPVGNASARIVLTAPAGSSMADPSNQAVVEEAVTRISSQAHVAAAQSPFSSGGVSRDGATAIVQVTYAVPSEEVTEADREALDEVLAGVERSGFGVAAGGSATMERPEPPASELIGLLVAALVLIVTFGSLVAAGLPLLTAVVGVALGVLGIQVATGLFELSSSTMTLATMLGLAVGIDYALFILSRYRHELLETRDPEEAIGTAVGTAGSAVVFAGLTVAIALVALGVVGIPFLTAMGLAAAATVAVAVVIALTLLPALLGFAGSRILGRRGYAARDTEEDTPGHARGERWSRLVVRHRGVVAAAAVALLAVMAIPVLSLRLGLPTDASAPEGSSRRLAYDQVAASFGPGVNGPLVVAVDLSGAANGAAALERVSADLAAATGVAAAMPPMPSAGGDLAIVTVIPTSAPSDPATEALVRDIRARADGWLSDTGAAVYVTGETAVAIDVSDKLGDALIPYLAVIVGLAFLLLVLVFRSILVPMKATLGFLLTVAAVFGAVVAVFQWGWLGDLIGLETTGPIISFLPIILIGILFGLAMDYEVFLVTRMREAFVHGAAPDDAIHEGFRHGARVVTAAAAIMIGVFSGFILTDDPIIKSIGFGLALGVLVDAFVVRMTVVPAVMSMLGRRGWWLPSALDTLIPNIDIEGARLRTAAASGSAAPELVLTDAEAVPRGGDRLQDVRSS